MAINLGEVLLSSWKVATGLSAEEILSRAGVNSVTDLKNLFCKRAALHMHEKGRELTPSQFEEILVNNPVILKQSIITSLSALLDDEDNYE